MANKNRNKLIILPALGLAALSSAVILGATPESFAVETKTGTSTVTVNIGSVLSLSVPTSITVDIAAPTSDGVFASGTGTVGVTTNNAAGYSVYLTSNSSSTTLDHTTNTSAKINSIAAAETVNSGGKFSTNNTWGWSSNGTSFKPVAASGTANGSSTLFKQTSSAATSQENSTLTIGVTANTSLVAGSYSGVIKLTAITN